jgi:DNA polymerase-3 subunit epsilon
MADLIFFDTETTGLSAEDDRIIEVAAIACRQTSPGVWERVAEYVQEINPEQEVGQRASEINGKTWGMLVDKPVFAEVAQDIMTFFHGRDIIAQNLSFDYKMLNAEFARCGFGSDWLKDNTGRKGCTRQLSRQIYKKGKHSLDAMADRHGIDRSNREIHTALIDTELLMKVFWAMQDDAAFELMEFRK